MRRVVIIILILFGSISYGQKPKLSTRIDAIFQDTIQSTSEQLFRVSGTSYLLTLFLEKINSKYYLNIVDVDRQFNFQVANSSDRFLVKLYNDKSILMNPDRVSTTHKDNLKNYEFVLRCQISLSQLQSIKDNGIKSFHVNIDFNRWDFEIPESYKNDLTDCINLITGQ